MVLVPPPLKVEGGLPIYRPAVIVSAVAGNPPLVAAVPADVPLQ
jgi:hypothetical protein